MFSVSESKLNSGFLWDMFRLCREVQWPVPEERDGAAAETGLMSRELICL